MRTVLRALLALALLVPLVLVVAPAAQAAPDDRPTFIVTLRSGEPRSVAAEHARRHGADITFVYEHALRGYAAKVSEGEIGALARDGRVARVERDGPVQALATDSTATWGLDRIDARSGLDGSYTYNATGAGVTAYIIDTGIRNSHTDFGGRAFDGYDAVSNDLDTDDCNGHGTHVAGTVGGTEHGVAKGVKLVGVRVLDCNGSGTWSGVIAGVDWVTENAVKPAVANMSLGGGANSSVDTAVQNSIKAGISYAVAAGNSSKDACRYSPARVPEAMTIGATVKSDARASYSNHGSCVDFFAPGSGITSAWHTGDTDINTISGTSMASPHAAGAAALYLEGNSSATPLQVRDVLYNETTKGIVTSSSTANNHLLHTLGLASAAPTTAPPAPTGVTAVATSSSEIVLDWTDASTNEDGFRIERSTDGTTFVERAVLGPNVTTYTDGGLSPSTEYWYRVTAFNTAGGMSADPVSATTPADTTSTPTTATISATCDKTTCTFDASPDVSDPSWQFGDGSAEKLGDPVSHTFANTAAVYTVSLWSGGQSLDTIEVDCRAKKGPFHRCSASG